MRTLPGRTWICEKCGKSNHEAFKQCVCGAMRRKPDASFDGNGDTAPDPHGLDQFRTHIAHCDECREGTAQFHLCAAGTTLIPRYLGLAFKAWSEKKSIEPLRKYRNSRDPWSQ